MLCFYQKKTYQKWKQDPNKGETRRAMAPPLFRNQHLPAMFSWKSDFVKFAKARKTSLASALSESRQRPQENTLLQWILQNILENQMFQRIAKFIMADFYEMDFMKGSCYISKSR